MTVDLESSLQTVGSSTIFLVLPLAETRWSELRVILRNVVGNMVIDDDMVPSLSYQEKTGLVKNDPVTDARYFEYRMRRQQAYTLQQVPIVYTRKTIISSEETKLLTIIFGRTSAA